jgi:hypothetical protein
MQYGKRFGSRALLTHFCLPDHIAMKRIINALCFVFAILVFPGCSQAEPDYFPRPSIGTVMTYSCTTYNPLIPETKKWKKTVRFEDEVELGGKRYFKKIAVVDLPGLAPFISYNRWANDGIYSYDTTNKREFLVQPFVVAGQEYDIFIRHYKVSVENVYLPDRTLKDCLKISISYQGDGGVLITEESLYAPKLGLVKYFSKASTGKVYEEIFEPTTN